VLLETWPLRGHARLLDLFGGHGRGCRTLVAGTPGLSGAFLDLPEVVAQAPTAERVSAVAGDGFAASLPEGFDVITVIRSAHDLDDEHAALIVRRAFEALPVGGELILAERMVVPGDDAERELRLRDLAFVLVGPHLRVREPGAYVAMLERAGFTASVRRAHRDPHPFYRGMVLVAGRK
jgi:demethylspheroidene O-methyltransferase